MNLTLHQDS